MVTDTEEILTELLLCLLAKSIIRFKMVSKRWLSIISSQYFSQLHATHHCVCKPELSLLLHVPTILNHYYLQSTLLKLVPYNFPSALEDPVICSFSNDCHVYDPTTTQSRKIPFSTNEMYPIVSGLNIVIDPLKSPYYKIICVRFAQRRISGLFSHSRLRCCHIQVYESEIDTWKFCGEQFLAPSDLDFDRVFFDLDNIQDEKLVAVFELQRDYSQWLLKHRIDLDPNFGPLSVLSMVGGFGEEDFTLLIHKPEKIIAYGFVEKSFKEVMDFKKEMFYKEHYAQFVSGFTYQFIETLAPV